MAQRTPDKLYPETALAAHAGHDEGVVVNAHFEDSKYVLNITSVTGHRILIRLCYIREAISSGRHRAGRHRKCVTLLTVYALLTAPGSLLTSNANNTFNSNNTNNTCYITYTPGCKSEGIVELVYAIIAARHIVHFPYRSKCAQVIDMMRQEATTTVVYAPPSVTTAHVCSLVRRAALMSRIPMRMTRWTLTADMHDAGVVLTMLQCVQSSPEVTVRIQSKADKYVTVDSTKGIGQPAESPTNLESPQSPEIPESPDSDKDQDTTRLLLAASTCLRLPQEVRSFITQKITGTTGISVF